VLVVVILGSLFVCSGCVVVVVVVAVVAVVVVIISNGVGVVYGGVVVGCCCVGVVYIVGDGVGVTVVITYVDDVYGVLCRWRCCCCYWCGLCR